MLAAMLFVLGTDAGTVATRLRGVLFDSYQRSAPRPYQDTLAHAGFRVRELQADAASEARFGAWPWPRATLAKLLGEMKARGAALAVFAFPLDTPDPASPKNLLPLVPPGAQNDPLRAALSQMASPDDGLAAAMGQLATVTGFALEPQSGRPAPALRATLRFVGAKNPFGHAPDFASATGVIAPVERASQGSGALNLAVDADGETAPRPASPRCRPPMRRSRPRRTERCGSPIRARRPRAASPPRRWTTAHWRKTGSRMPSSSWRRRAQRS